MRQQPDPSIGAVTFLWIGMLGPIVYTGVMAVGEGGLKSMILPIALAVLWTSVCAYGVVTGHVAGRKRRTLREVIKNGE